jgi:hypothetical protein
MSWRDFAAGASADIALSLPLADLGTGSSRHQRGRIGVLMAAVGTSQIGYRSKFYFLGIFRRRRFAEGNSFSAFCTVNRKIPFAGLDKAGHGEILGSHPILYAARDSGALGGGE